MRMNLLCRSFAWYVTFFFVIFWWECTTGMSGFWKSREQISLHLSLNDAACG